MKAKLVSRWGAEKGAEFWIDAEASIGRGADNDVRLEAKPVSSQHARIFFDPEAEAYFLEDLGSLNGTEVDGTPVLRSERLGRLHVVNFGGVCEMLFVTVDTTPVAPSKSDDGGEDEKAEPPAPGKGTLVDAEPPVIPEALAAGKGKNVTQIEEAPVVLPRELADDGKEAEEAPPGEAGPEDQAEPEPEADPEPEPQPEPEAEPQSEGEAAPEADDPAEPASDHQFVLAVIEKDTPRRFPLSEGENLVGRSKGAAVALASGQLSRRHAMLTVTGERVTVRDLGSRNHTFLDDLQVGEVEVNVEVRARLRFGLLEAYLLRHDDDDRTMPVEVDADR